MNKIIKKILKIALWTLTGLVLLLSGVICLLQYQQVQTYLAKKAVTYLAGELRTTVSLERLYFMPFSKLVLNGLYIADRSGDTLLYADEAIASVDLWKLRNREVIIKQVKIADGHFYVKQDAEGTNLSFIADYFRAEPSASSSGGRIALDIRSVILSNVSFGYKHAESRPATTGINFRDILLTGLNGSFTDINFTDHLFKSTIRNLKLRDKSGFILRELNASAVVDSGRLALSELYMETNRSRLRDYLLLEYDGFSAFSHFVDSVSATLDLRDARIHSQDIAFFAPDIGRIHFDLAVTGSFSGKVSSITARRTTLQLGNSTRLAGDFTISGLPDIERAVFDMQLSRLLTNSQDIEYLIPQLGNSTPLKLPALFERLGALSYQGRLSGYYYDFIAEGTLETALGTVNTDINLHIRDGGRYAGRLTADDFALGTLLQHSQIGKSEFDLLVEGTGFAVNHINSKVEGHITHLDFRGYRYRHIDLQGEFAEMLFAGHMKVDDPNLRLDFDGGINFNPDQPEYAFDATVAYAHLRNIQLYDKSAIVIEGTTIASNFNGNTLNSVQGSLAIRDLRFQADSNRYAVDSLLLTASGNEGHRVIHLGSDIADGTMNGEIDLNTLSGYFKSVAMQYAPSLELEITPPGKQAFDLNLTIKDFEPLAPLLAPRMALPDGALISARFSTASHTADLNFLAPRLTYGNISVSRLIVDESANGDALRLLVTADRISAADSLYIDNVNLSNVVARDSLHINLKLSDNTASNQLDFNALATFKKGMPILMQVLPSAIKLNSESWQLNEDSQFHLADGKLIIKNLEIASDRQVAQLDGTISADANDKASITFSNFNLSTFTPLTLSSGIELSGELNGQMNISSVLKNPYAVADMEAKNVHFNHTELGDLLLRANFDRISELVNVKLEATRGSMKTMVATGTYNAAAENDKLDVNASLNQSELQIFQPFFSKLVSDISGTVSADLHVTGSVTDPRISGKCRFHDAKFTVNYLKTAYKINDEVSLANSTLVLNNLIITDPRDNKAIANGEVDLRNPLVPVIDITVDAADFLVLNTTFRDNPLYYGTAYGTGRFVFDGPTTAMNIHIQARTGGNTSFFIPLNAGGTISDDDFIRFVRHDTVKAPQPRTRLFRGLGMSMDLQITPEAEISLFTDLGELSGRGEGLISMRISSLGDFEMFGDYAINSGKFTFTAQDFINKIFDINQGGSIRWTGQPADATINLTAVYAQRTSLGPLYNAAGREAVEQRVLAHAEMHLNGSLTRPDITFGLNFPNDSYVKDELQSYLSDANNVNQQALSLIVRRSFAPGSATDFSRELNNTLLSAGTELAFNQLNNLIAQSLRLNFMDLNIRSLNEASASVRLFNDRLIFTGGITDRRNLNDLNVFSDRVVTDAELLYLIRKDGRLVLRGSNRLNSRNFLPLTINENYVSALGLVYRQEFYTFQEYFRRLFTIRRETEAEEKQDQ
ncbi:translocation/assembly module TamB domain-containing protein [Parapedobacter deserti]|uniref:Translocation/assembly module TamB domain-containing protein n=1 Tax=Parapedobacter deserti TaxID=1912957 RepID=A0ABV7JIC4_9SPHI